MKTTDRLELGEIMSCCGIWAVNCVNGCSGWILYLRIQQGRQFDKLLYRQGHADKTHTIKAALPIHLALLVLWLFHPSTCLTSSLPCLHPCEYITSSQPLGNSKQSSLQVGCCSTSPPLTHILKLPSQIVLSRSQHQRQSNSR